jgi:hypothetical protein
LGQRVCDEVARLKSGASRIPSRARPGGRGWRGGLRSFESTEYAYNQTDIKEKSEQIPRMGKIYGSAEQVLAWLGPNGNGEDAMIREVFEKANELDCLYQQPEIGLAALPAFSSYLAEGDGTTNFKTFCETIVSVIQRPWFSRVWVVQEAVLARDPAILLAGRAATTVHNLYFLWATLRMYVKDGLIRQDLVAGIRIGHFESTRLMIQSEKWRTLGCQPDLASFAKQLYQLLNTAASSLKSTLPQDMIYGISQAMRNHGPKCFTIILAS